MDTVSNTYPALAFPASELSAFAVTIDCFIISLKNGTVISFTPDDLGEFYHWLIIHNIRDIHKKETKKETPSVTNSSNGWKGLFKKLK
ncbi:hypothetical protein CMT72_17055 [Elizabethkingia anophelis]|nr:hypothetical protein [Terrimonas sp.]MDV3734895.1 hypothetical protein [Elizabethkingia anophelis]MDV3964603.1 hypothetical protein [Elizabethkingia anophelis]OJY93892.1 MAG: hypothetical protein BGP13_01220 [Sphingobacteriales bacterium 40-81]